LGAGRIVLVLVFPKIVVVLDFSVISGLTTTLEEGIKRHALLTSATRHCAPPPGLSPLTTDNCH
jgi:hypothetical protein